MRRRSAPSGSSASTVVVAVPKGRVLGQLAERLSAAGLDGSVLLQDDRRLIRAGALDEDRQLVRIPFLNPIRLGERADAGEPRVRLEYVGVRPDLPRVAGLDQIAGEAPAQLLAHPSVSRIICEVDETRGILPNVVQLLERPPRERMPRVMVEPVLSLVIDEVLQRWAVINVVVSGHQAVVLDTQRCARRRRQSSRPDFSEQQSGGFDWMRTSEAGLT